MHVAVVGAGLAGLTAAALLRQGGATVTLCERGLHVGGRARSSTQAGAVVNLGPHALYRASFAVPVLRRLGIRPAGGVPPNAGLVRRGGALHALPGGPWSFASSTALSFVEKLRLPAWLVSTPPDVTVAEWLDGAPGGVADMLRAVVRVSSYCAAPEILSARAAMTQVRRAFRGVTYLDGGWGALCDALAAVCDAPRLGVEASRSNLGFEPDAVVLTGPPSLARAWGVEVPELLPVRAACLDLVLDGLPRPAARFVLGLDEPTYLSEHGSLAKLGGTVLHAARYLAPGETAAVESLEALLDEAQPGWRTRVLFRRFLPEIVVSHRIDRPGERVSGQHGDTWLAGDWVGEEGMLADRALASAARAADAILARMR